MRLSFVTLSMLFLTLNVLVARNIFGQNIRKTTVSLTLQQGTLKDVFTQIEQQTEFRFAYPEYQVAPYKQVEVPSGRQSLSDVLNNVLAGTQLSYSQRGNTIIVLEDPDKKPLPPVTGVVRNASGEPLEGVSVSVKDSKIGTSTTANGGFSLNVKKGDVLVFSRIGYEAREITISDQPSIEITLTALEGRMDEIVVVGYGTQKRENVTGAVAQIQMEKVLGDRPVTSLGAALQGAIAGFTTSSSVVPGEGNQFNIRGYQSINGGAPLILVDGVVQANLYLLNPNDIETVTVLKDAASAAIYGARASFGVVLITTKKGKKNETISIDYSGNFAFNKVNNRPRVATPEQIVKGLKDMGYTAYWSGQNIDTWETLLNEYKADPSKYPLGWTDVNGTKYFLKQTDLIGEMIEPGFQQMHNLSVQGGSQNISYRLSLGRSADNGVLITDKDLFKKTNVATFVDGKINKWLSSALDVKYASGFRTYPNAAGQNSGFWKTNVPSYHPNDSLPFNGVNYEVNTPKHLIENASKQSWVTNDVRLLSRTVLAPVKNLKVTFEYTYQHSDANNKRYNNYFVLHQGLQDALNPSDPSTQYYVQKTLNDYTSINAYANYSLKIGAHNLAAVGGFNQEASNYELQWSRAFNMISNELPFLGGASGSTPPETGDDFDRYTLRGVFGRITYNYAQRYFLELNSRYDLSSKFPSAYRGGFFPSVSAGWNIAKEDFARGLSSSVQTFKLRASLGELGNQNVSNYGFLPTMAPYDAAWIYGGITPKTLRPPGMVRANYTWEKVRTLNGGVDIGILQNRLTASFDIYKRLTLGMLAPGMDFPAVAGAKAPYQNAADLKTNGWELTMNWTDKAGDFNYGLGFNVYDSRTVITKYKNETKLLSAPFYEGEQIGEIWGYVTDGFYTADDFNENGTLKEGVVSINGVISHEGDIKYKNLRDGTNSVNRIDQGDNTLSNPGDRKIIGNDSPRFSYGVNGFAGWKGINLSFMLQGVAKRDAWIGGDIMFPHAGQFSTFYAHELNYWTPTNTNAWYGRIYQNAQESHGANQRVQTRFLQSAAYMRVKNITLSYTLPAHLITKGHLKNVKVFYSGENLFTFSKLIEGIDPESLGWEYPHFVTHAFGINIGL
ncbi:TonB-dependent receptor [Niabella hirudinis]|uniref:TonB-dependent receptor n=1 Tax=Niabella hirudinis TaxID=1285929 RepID=UPI003EBA978D